MKRVLLALVVVLAAYVVLYYAIEHRRAAKGPWKVTFTQLQERSPAILINQSGLGITNVQISFPVSSNALANDSVTVSFGEAQRTPFDLPLGKCVFLDTVFLPGTVAIEVSGHQIQLLPRVLTIDGTERVWVSGESIFLTNKPSKSE